MSEGAMSKVGEADGALLVLEAGISGINLARELSVAAFYGTHDNPRRLFLTDLYHLLGRQRRELEELQSDYRRWVLGEGAEEERETWQEQQDALGPRPPEDARPNS